MSIGLFETKKEEHKSINNKNSKNDTETGFLYVIELY